MNMTNDKTLRETDLQKLKDLLSQMRQMQYTSSGYQTLDILTGGLIRGGVTLIASRPAVGKSSLVLNMVSRLSRQMTGSILFFSPRFREAEVTMRLLRIGTGLESRRFFDKILHAEDIAKNCTDLFNAQLSSIQINASTYPNLEQIRQCCKYTPDLRLLVVDSIERITEPFVSWKDPHGMEASYEPKDKSLGFLKMLALDLDIPVICTTGLHRSLERRKNKRPKLSDLTKTDVPSQLVDQVLFLYRDRYYDPYGKDGAEIIVARNNNGATGVVELGWDYGTCRFDEVTNNFTEYPLIIERGVQDGEESF